MLRTPTSAHVPGDRSAATCFRPFGIEPESSFRLAASRINQALRSLLHPRRFLRERWAQRRLAEIVAQTRASFECEQYRRRRAAALKGIKKPSGGGRRTNEGKITYAKA